MAVGLRLVEIKFSKAIFVPLSVKSQFTINDGSYFNLFFCKFNLYQKMPQTINIKAQNSNVKRILL